MDDILDEQDTAELLEILPGFVPDDEDDIEQDTEIGVKNEDVTLFTAFEHEPVALNTLKTRLAGHAPWLEDSIPYPLVPSNHYSPRGQTFAYSPKVFYYSERAYEDWIEMDGVNHLFHWVNESHRDIPPASKSPYVLTETWQCHFAGKPEIKVKKEGVKRRAVYKSYKARGCGARIYVHKYKDPHPAAEGYPLASATRRVRVTYYGVHTNHVLGDKDDFQHLSLSNSLKEAILGYVKLGLGRRAIKDKLTLHSDELHSRLSKGTLTRDDFVTSSDISNIHDDYWRRLTVKNEDPHISLSMWADTWEEAGNFVFRWSKSVVDDKGKEVTKTALGFSSPWQMEKLRASGGAIGLDSTHKICSGSAELYTIIVQDPHTLRGIPVAFLLTEDKTAEPLQQWLVGVEAYAGISFRYITTDDSSVEYKAIKQGLGDHVRIHLCLWHIARAWNTQIKARVKHDNPVKRQILQAEARKAMHDIMYQPDPLIARNMIVNFRLFCQENSKPLLEYMEDNYFAEERRLLWMKSYRQDVYYGAMDTNNYVESWHNQLKANHLKNHYRARPDRILYILTVSVLEIFKKEEFGVIIQVGRKTKGQVLDILRRRDVEAMSDEIIEKHVIFIEGRCTVESLTYPGLYYALSLAVNLIQGCSCEYFARYRRLCKHTLMAVRKFPILRLPFNNNFCTPSVLGTVATATLNYAVMEAKKVEEEHKIEQAEQDKIEHEREQKHLKERFRALTESLLRYTRDATIDVDSVQRLECLVDHVACLPANEGNRKQRQKQK